MTDTAHVVTKITRLLRRLTPPQQADAMYLLRQAFRGGLSSAQRMQRRRDRIRDENVTVNGDGNVTDHRDENVTILCGETVTKTSRRRDENVTTSSPKTPPASSFSPAFLRFWSKYPKRIGKGKAYETWRKRKCEALEARICEALEKQNGYLTREGGEYTPNPATWLNQLRWEDEPPVAVSVSKTTAKNIENLRRFVAKTDAKTESKIDAK